jgi:hypothetical protein
MKKLGYVLFVLNVIFLAYNAWIGKAGMAVLNGTAAVIVFMALQNIETETK